MAGLPKSLIKKYGVSKKAWAVFRKQKNKRRTVRSRKRVSRVSRTTKTQRRSSTMAKRRRRKSKPMMSAGMKGALSKVGIVLYGGMRSKMSNALANSAVGRLIPATRVSDEIGMYGLAYVAGRLGGHKIPVVNSMIRTAKTVELARIGEELFQGGLLSLGGSSQSSGQLF